MFLFPHSQKLILQTKMQSLITTKLKDNFLLSHISSTYLFPQELEVSSLGSEPPLTAADPVLNSLVSQPALKIH